jgi:hypothetical protein
VDNLVYLLEHKYPQPIFLTRALRIDIGYVSSQCDALSVLCYGTSYRIPNWPTNPGKHISGTSIKTPYLISLELRHSLSYTNFFQSFARLYE